MKNVAYLLLCSLCLGCHDVVDDKQMLHQYPVQSKVLNQAVPAFLKLQNAGQLPAFGPNEHGTLESIPLGGESAVSSYPWTVTIKVDTEKTPGWLLYYTIQKEDAQSEWKLVKAWKQSNSTGESTDLMTSEKK